MIVDLEPRDGGSMFITEQVASIKEQKGGHWVVRFVKSSRVFQYSRYRLLCLTNPEEIHLGERGLYVNNRRITDVAQVLRFAGANDSYYRITYANGSVESLVGRQVYITRTPIDKCGDASLWQYLNKLADETGLLIDDVENILSRQYALVDIQRDNVPLAQYLGSDKPLAQYPLPEEVYFPFGCNASQKQAVEMALTHQMSIIQGPPGTGKTQTILNIVANLLMANKTILIVSHNNTAVENVAEKLKAEQLDFLVAHLGNKENIYEFIKHQPKYPKMNDWLVDDVYSVKRLLHSSRDALSRCFEWQTKLAQLQTEYDALLTEITHNQGLCSHLSVEPWLADIPSAKLMRLLTQMRTLQEEHKHCSFLVRLRYALRINFKLMSFLCRDLREVIPHLEQAYYTARKAELERKIDDTRSKLNRVDVETKARELQQSSMQMLKAKITERFRARGERKQFIASDVRLKSEAFLSEYPIVLSTTYSCKNCISPDMVFDYAIMDEASQVDIKTGALTLSCAVNVVVVGDDKQLPNVVSTQEALTLNVVRSMYEVDERYDAITHSFLRSCVKVFRGIPSTLLREHYRCCPKIIEFCNQRFYDGELVCMTPSLAGHDALRVVRTVPGNHAREHINHREIDVIRKEVLPLYEDKGSIGIITPYKEQAKRINQIVGMDIASTIHKYQGRERDVIILSMVDNQPTAFSDDDNLLNVAISRAKKHLCLVMTGNDISPGSNLSQLISYIQYNNYEVRTSGLYSVFDLLYKPYTKQRLAYQAKSPQGITHLSEALVYDVLISSLSQLGWSNVSLVCHYPLSRLIADWSILQDEERTFAESPWAHVDFLLYGTVSKRPMLTIEVDGWAYHQAREVQSARDLLKDQILSKYGLNPLRISTTSVLNVETMVGLLAEAVCYKPRRDV